MSQDERDQRVEESCGSSTVGWFVTGALIGAAVGVLYAPKSGKENREFLSGKVQQSKDAVADAGAGIAETGKDMFERGRQLVEDAADLFERGRKLVQG